VNPRSGDDTLSHVSLGVGRMPFEAYERSDFFNPDLPPDLAGCAGLRGSYLGCPRTNDVAIQLERRQLITAPSLERGSAAYDGCGFGSNIASAFFQLCSLPQEGHVNGAVCSGNASNSFGSIANPVNTSFPLVGHFT